MTGAVRIVRARREEELFMHVVMAPCGWLLLAWTKRHVVLALDPITGEEVAAGQIDCVGGLDGSRSVALLDTPIWIALPYVPTATSASTPSAAAATPSAPTAATAQSVVAPASARAVMYVVEHTSNAVRCCTLPEWMMQPHVGMRHAFIAFRAANSHSCFGRAGRTARVSSQPHHPQWRRQG
jgi:hypothetical protein